MFTHIQIVLANLLLLWWNTLTKATKEGRVYLGCNSRGRRVHHSEKGWKQKSMAARTGSWMLTCSSTDSMQWEWTGSRTRLLSHSPAPVLFILKFSKKHHQLGTAGVQISEVMGDILFQTTTQRIKMDNFYCGVIDFFSNSIFIRKRGGSNEITDNFCISFLLNTNIHWVTTM